MLEDITVEFLATFLIWFLYAGLLVLWLIDGRIKKEQVIHALLASLAAWLITLLIKHFFPTIRPFVRNGGEVDVLFKPTDAAFPSAHTALAFSLAVTVFMHNRKVGWFYLGGALLIGIARVLANVHYPIDILGGALIGTLVAVVAEKVHVFKFLQRKRGHY
ncbi:MAG: phosphatase PAP2 family protein [Candidatus Woesebacteria bacterium]|nr:phosphatase PAP2 family protein [Candidatus Woesebacteria bacterium]